MTGSALPEPLETLAIPDDAIVLPVADGRKSSRELAIAALQQALRARLLNLPLGPALELADPQRLLVLNGFQVQLLCQGITADLLELPLAPWRDRGTAPQLVLAALIEEDNGVVCFPGTLTGSELQSAVARQGWDRPGEALSLPVEIFHGGVDRLLTLVQLLDPAALPRLTLQAPGCTPLAAAVRSGAVAVVDWLRGQLDETLAALGGELTPVTAGAFRHGGLALESTDPALATVVIPLGLAGEELVSGAAAQRCVQRFQLALMATGRDRPSGLVLQLSSAVAGALLPDDLTLEARQGSHSQSIRSAGSTELRLVFQGSPELLDVSLRYSDREGITLPPLQLPA